jgi:hypothetical protein
MPLYKRLLKAKAQHGRGTAWYELIFVGDLPKFGFFRLRRAVSRLVGSDFSGYTKTFTKDTALLADGRGTAWYV